MGAGVSSWFAATFPEHVSRLIMLDLIAFGPMPVKKQVRATRKSVEQAVNVHDKLESVKGRDDKLPRFVKFKFP